jgi:hypothetical protein
MIDFYIAIWNVCASNWIMRNCAFELAAPKNQTQPDNAFEGDFA